MNKMVMVVLITALLLFTFENIAPLYPPRDGEEIARAGDITFFNDLSGHWVDQFESTEFLLLWENISLNKGKAFISNNTIIPDDSTVGLWHFENSGGTLTDSSPNGNDGTLLGGSRTSGKFGYGIYLNDTWDHADLGNFPFSYADNSFSSQGWFNSTNTGWDFKRILTFSPQKRLGERDVDPYPTAQLLLTPDNFNYSRARADGGDLRFYTEEHEPVEYWMENWNPLDTSSIWLNLTGMDGDDIHMYYGNSKAQYQGIDWRGNLTLMSTRNAGSLPPGWTLNDVLLEKFPRGNLTYGGTGGQNQHFHAISGTTESATPSMSDNIRDSNDNMGQWPQHNHIHSYLGDTDNNTSLPPYLNITFFSTATIPNELPISTVAMFTELPVGGDWRRFHELDGRFPRCHGDDNQTGGTPMHSHGYFMTTSIPLSMSWDSILKASDDMVFWPSTGHTHAISGDTMDATSLPPFLNMVFGATQNNTSLPHGMVGIFDSLPPMGWSRFTELDNKFPRGNSTYGSQGGASSHIHTYSGTSTSPSENESPTVKNAGNTAKDYSDSGHQHPYSGTTSPASNIPPYFNVTYGQRKMSSFDIDMSSETPTALAKAGQFGLGITSNYAYSSVGGNTLKVPVAPGWNHLTQTYDGVEHKLYVNGEMAGCERYNNTGAEDLSPPLLLGKGFAGFVDEVALFNRDLTSDEVREMSRLYRPIGNLRSTNITLPEGNYWDSLSLNATVPSTTKLSISIHDAYTHEEILALEPGNGEVNASLVMVNALDHECLYIDATLESGKDASPEILWWKFQFSNITSPELIGTPENIIVVEDKPRQDILDISDYFQDKFSVVNLPLFEFEQISEKNNASFELNNSLLSVTFLKKDWYGDINLVMKCTNTYGYVTTSEIFSIRVTMDNDPPVANLLFPKDNMLVSNNFVTLFWSLGDVDNDQGDLSVDLYVGKSPTPELYRQNIKTTSYVVEDIDDDETYYWSVTPMDNETRGNCLNGTWSFTVNLDSQGPEVELVSPECGAILNKTDVVLLWSQNFVMEEDCQFRVYFGTDRYDLPIYAVTNRTELSIGGLENNKYYWSVIPITGSIVGKCINGQYDFTINISYLDRYDLETTLDKERIEIMRGETGEFNVTLANMGNKPFRTTIEPVKEWGWNVTVESSVTLEVGGSARVPVVVDNTSDMKKGSYTLTLELKWPHNTRNLTSIVSITERTEQIDDLPKDQQPEKEKEEFDYTFIGIFVLLIIALLLILLIITNTTWQHKKRRGREKDETIMVNRGLREFVIDTVEDREKKTAERKEERRKNLNLDDIKVLAEEPQIRRFKSGDAPTVIKGDIPFEIKDIFLIYVDGRLMKHFSLSSDIRKEMDKEIMSSMLTVITDFVKDSFSITTGALKTLQYGKMNIYIERGMSMYLAVVFQGNVSNDLREKMRWLLIRIWDLYRHQIKEWDGDEKCLKGIDELLGALAGCKKNKFEPTENVIEGKGTKGKGTKGKGTKGKGTKGKGTAGEETARKGSAGKGAEEKNVREREGPLPQTNYHCSACLSVIEENDGIKCECGKTYHIHCSKKVKICPSCNRNLGDANNIRKTGEKRRGKQDHAKEGGLDMGNMQRFSKVNKKKALPEYTIDEQAQKDGDIFRIELDHE